MSDPNIAAPAPRLALLLKMMNSAIDKRDCTLFFDARHAAEQMGVRAATGAYARKIRFSTKFIAELEDSEITDQNFQKIVKNINYESSSW